MRYPETELRERLEHDLRQSPEADRWTLGDSLLDPEDELRRVIPVFENGGLAMYLPCPDADEPHLETCISISADSLQQLIMDDRTGPLVALDAWPRCPIHHGHPLTAEIVDGAASWICPHNQSLRWRIGDLGQAVRR